MGGYFGSVSGILKNNKNLLPERNRRERKGYIGVKEILTEDHIKASPELLAQIRKKFRRQKINNIVFPILITLVVCALIYCVIIY